MSREPHRFLISHASKSYRLAHPCSHSSHIGVGRCFDLGGGGDIIVQSFDVTNNYSYSFDVANNYSPIHETQYNPQYIIYITSLMLRSQRLGGGGEQCPPILRGELPSCPPPLPMHNELEK